jgi:hypothetical protein
MSMDTERERIERILVREFDAVKPFEPADLPKILPYKNGGFMPSMLGFMLYANGYSLRGTSKYCPNGLIYDDGETLFAIGIFRKTLESPIWHIMVNGPWGKDGFRKVDEFIRKLKTLVEPSEIFVRHLTKDLYDTFCSNGYIAIDASPWCDGAAAEDETFNHKSIPLADIVGYDSNGQFEIRTLQSTEHKGFRVKARLAFNRFTNFLERNGFTFEIRDYTIADRDVAEKLMRHHFEILKNPVGSTPEDYLSLINCDPVFGGDECFGKIGFLVKGDVRIPALLFLGEKTGADTVALYATFANRDSETLGDPSIDTTGFTAISQYSYLILFRMLIDMGITCANVGGSETEELNKFKRQLGAKEEATYWAVAPRSLHAPAPEQAREQAKVAGILSMQ